jgi:hypothetical protein
MLALFAMIAGMLSRMAFDEGELEYYNIVEHMVFSPMTLVESALASGIWSLVAGPLWIASIWLIIVFAYDGAGGAMTLFALYVFSYLIVMFRGTNDSPFALVFGGTLVVALVVVWMRKRRAEIET